MQKNETGFKMSFKKRNPDFKKPPKKISATIPATGDLRKHDQPTRVMKKSDDMENSSSSEEDVLEKTRKAELENQKSEQAKLVEMALLEQVMNGQIDVLDLLKSGQVDSSSLKEKLQKQMQNIDGVPTSNPEPTAAPAPAPVQAPPPAPAVQAPAQKQAAYNPLMRNRDGSNPPTAKKQKSESRESSKSKKKKTTGSISSESSESSSDSSIDTDISSESDSDEDSHKLAKKVKKLKTKNKKLQKKVKSLKKKLKEKKSEKKDDKQAKSKSLQRNSHGQIVENKVPPRPQPPPPPVQQATGALAPMTPQQYTAQQSQVRRQYDPQTGQYRDVPENIPPAAPPGLMPQGVPGQIPSALPGMPPFPMPPLGQMPAMPPGPIPPLPMSAGPLPLPTNINPSPFPSVSSSVPDNEVMEIKNARRNSPVKNYPSDDDLYLDVFKGKEKEKPKINTNLKQSNDNRSSQPNQNRIQTSNQPRVAPGQTPIPSIESLKRAGLLSSQQFQQQPQQQQPQQSQQSYNSQNVQEQQPKPSHHERGYQPPSSSDSEPEQDPQTTHDQRRRKSSERSEVVVRSNAAKNLIKDFYEEEELAVVAPEEEAASGSVDPVAGAPKSEGASALARGVTFSGKCIFCNLYHTVNANKESSSICKKGKMYLDRYKADTRRIQQLRTDIKENTDKLVSLKNKKELMAKVIVENDVRKNERAQRMEAFRKHIDSLPQPVKVSQEFGRKVVKAQSNQQNLGNQLQAAIDRGNSAAQSGDQERPEQPEYDELDGHSMPPKIPSSSNNYGGQNVNPQSRIRRAPGHSSESEFMGRSEERSNSFEEDPQYDDYGQGRRPPQQRLGPREQGPPRPREHSRRDLPLRDHPQREQSPIELSPREQPRRELTPREPPRREPPPREPLSREPLSREPISREPLSREPLSREPLSREPLYRELPRREPPPREPLSREPISRELGRHPRDIQESSRGPPFSHIRASPGPPPRTPSAGLLQTPAAGPPQRPPPAALLRTPGNRPQYMQDEDNAPSHHAAYNTSRPRHGWSGGRGR